MMDIEAQTQKISEQAPPAGKLLSVQERAVCEQLARGTDQHNQWAQALLAIDEGASRSEAAQRSGLTSRQARYWLAKFRKLGLGIFPQQALEDAAEELIVSEPAVLEAKEQVETASQETEAPQSVEALGTQEVAEEQKAEKPKKKKKKDKKGKNKGKKKDGKKGKSKKGDKKKSKKKKG